MFSSEGGCSLFSSVVLFSFGGLNRAAKCDTFCFRGSISWQSKMLFANSTNTLFPFDAASLQKCYIQGIQKDCIVM